MIYLKLFLVFLEIGAVSFGGGYGMIPLIKELTVSNGWLSESELLDIVAVAESTPGPIAVNAATFIGSRQGGFFGSLCATAGVVLPSFVIILLIAAVMRSFLNRKGVQGFLGGVRPCVVALILGTSVTLSLSVLFGVGKISDGASVDIRALVIFALLPVIPLVSNKLFKKKPSPIIMIIISAVLGMAAYSIPNP